ncbi:MAG: secretin N-terminal domain-containing protein [Candidatus Omnitrophota bacterium]
MKRNAGFAFILTAVFAVMCLWPLPLPGDETVLRERKPLSQYEFEGLKKKISLDLRAMDIVDVLKFLAIEGNLNIVTSKDVTGPVSLLINDVNIGDALEMILALNNYAYEVQGNIIKIMTAKDYKSLYGVDFYDQKMTVIRQLKYASAKNVATMMGSVKSEIGKIIYDDSTGTIVMIDTPAKIREMEEIINSAEMPTVTRVLPTDTKVFELKYAIADNIKEEVSKSLTPDIGSMRIDKRTNTIVVTDLPHQLKKIETIIGAFDRKTREVFIEAKIVEVTLSDMFQWGIDWSYITQYTRKINGESRSYSITPEANLPLGLTGTYGQLTLASLNTANLAMTLQALDTVGETKILSNPHLTVEENREATIKVIEKQPYMLETTTTASGGTTTTSKNYEFVDVGVMLNVKPLINEDGYISMLIKPEVSSISTWYGGAAQAAGSVPVVKSANAETTVTIKDGVSIIIAGLIKDNKTKTVNKLPVLGDLPLVGLLFKNVSDDIRRTETVVFLTPRIVEGDRPFLMDRDMPKESKGIRQ